MDDLPVTGLINVTDKFHLDQLPVFCPERQVFITYVPVLLQDIKCNPAGVNIPECADFPQFLFLKLWARISKQIDQIGIDILDGAGPRIQNEDAVLSSLEQAPVTKFRFFQVLV